MIVDDVDLIRSISGPSEDDPPLVVHADAVPTLQVTAERLESVPRWREQIRQRAGVVEHVELSLHRRKTILLAAVAAR